MANMNIDFDFGTINTAIEKVSENGKVLTRWERSYTDKDGKVKTIEVTNPKVIKTLVTIDNLAIMSEFSSIGMAFELSALVSDINCLNGFKSIAEVGSKLFGLKASTSTQYARVGKYFVSKVESDGKCKYKLVDWLPQGTTITNLVQSLTLINEELENPLEVLENAIESGDLNINGTLARVKEDIKKLTKKSQEDDNVVNAEKVTELSSEKVESKDNGLDELITKLLGYADNEEYEECKPLIVEFCEKIKEIIG